MNSNEIINCDEKFLVPEVLSTNHWRNASTAFLGTKFCLSKKNIEKKKLRTRSLKKRKNFLHVKVKRCKSSPLSADHQLLKKIEPRALQRSNTSTLQPRRLQFGDEQTNKAKIEVLKIKTPKTFVSEKPKRNAIVTVDLEDVRNDFQSFGTNDSAPAQHDDELDAKKQSFNTVESKLKAKKIPAYNAPNKIPKKNNETIEDASSPVIEFENGRSLALHESESLADSGTKSIPNKLTCADKLETTSATLNKDAIANKASLKATQLSIQDVQNCKLLEGNANGTSAKFSVSVGKSVNGESLCDADINHDISLGPEIDEKLMALDPHIQQSCATKPVNRLESLKQIEMAKLKAHTQPVKLRGLNKKSDSETEPKLQLDQRKEKNLDKPEKMVTAGPVKLPSAKHELKRGNSREACLISNVTDHGVKEASDQALQNNLPSLEKPLNDICKTKDVSKADEVQQHSTENKSKVASVIKKINVINTSNKTRRFETTPRVVATPQRNQIKDEHKREIIPADGSSMEKIIKETPSEKKPLVRGFETPVQKSNIADTDQICESPSKSACKSESKLVQNSSLNDSLREIKNKKECDNKNRGEILDKSNANKN